MKQHRQVFCQLGIQLNLATNSDSVGTVAEDRVNMQYAAVVLNAVFTPATMQRAQLCNTHITFNCGSDKKEKKFGCTQC